MLQAEYIIENSIKIYMYFLENGTTNKEANIVDINLTFIG